jgi:hypothetical protein
MQGLLLVSRIAAVVAVLAVTTGVAAAGGPSPKSLALRQSDLPANAHRTADYASQSAPLPGHLRAPAYAATYVFARGQKREQVHVIVIAPGSVGKARAVLRASVADAREFVDTVQHRAARIPRYGDDQYAVVTGDPGAEETGGRIWVRKGAIVWGLEIATDPLAHDFGLSLAQTLAELRTYAGRQQRRADGR